MGTSLARLAITIVLKDHPHAYGDKLLLSKPPSGMPGSSPRVWGQVTASAETADDVGIIPTRMGTSREFSPELK